MRKKVDILSKWLTLEVGKPLTEGPGEVEVQQIFLNGIQKKLKEYLEINQSRFSTVYM